MKPKAIYAGSFDPFTVGHFDILSKADEIFDVIVLIANNSEKKCMFDINARIRAVNEAINDVIVAEVYAFDGAVADFARENEIKYLIRGIRNSVDYGYEENIAQINEFFNSNIETIYFRASKDNGFVSSSLVREMKRLGKYYQGCLPYSKDILEGTIRGHERLKI